MRRLTSQEYFKWKAQYFKENKNGQPQRLGQAFYNEHATKNTGPMPDLFYEDDPAEADQIIMSNWVDF